MARALVVGCGCRGRELARALIERGHAVRGTTRDAGSLRTIEAAGAEAVIADPDRVGTLLQVLEGVSVIAWLMGSVDDREAAAVINGPRLESLLEAIVDAPVRGFVYEAAGTVDQPTLERGVATVGAASARFRLPVAMVDGDPHDHRGWVQEASRCVEQVLTGHPPASEGDEAER